MRPPDPDLAAAELKAMQDSIYREQISPRPPPDPRRTLGGCFRIDQYRFHRRRRIFSTQIQRETWLPTPEDVVVQKLRWGRSKDLDDARDVLAVQGPETLDMAYIEHWCALHGTLARLADALAGIPPLD